ncbi:acetyltransferase [Vibrio panuliri]|uniref:Acetyltransferase n=1 Tax=Vibrio panuliri TaxID=1381081 RepID=A0A1Q9HQY8_9VIBR|nr:GNAT family N-acetyltransferase [Vibrio panuliri]OLQ93297.1 acetyltransferase [Vibrio panuliri]
MMHQVTFDQAQQEFRVLLEQDLHAVVKYQQYEEDIFTITSTKVPDSLQGKGYGKVMMEAVLPEIERLGGKVVPECSFVVRYFEKNPHWQHLLAS